MPVNFFWNIFLREREEIGDARLFEDCSAAIFLPFNRLRASEKS